MEMKQPRFLLDGRPARCVALLGLLVACATSPLGRQQILLYPEAEVAQMGAAAFQRMRQEMPLARDAAAERYVSCVTRELARAVERGPDSWQVELFEDRSANAFALPGGKIGVHTGMLRVAENQDQLATVIAHEIAHVTAAHTNERLSTAAVAETGLSAVQMLLGGDSPGQRQLMGALGLGAQVGVLLPFGRAQESEADLLGLRLMARAGFDPRASVQLWRNMERQGGGSPPEFLSTHPSESSRIARLEQGMREVMPLYEQARNAGRRPDCR
jgi:predicted Zn-dependent protease